MQADIRWIYQQVVQPSLYWIIDYVRNRIENNPNSGIQETFYIYFIYIFIYILYKFYLYLNLYLYPFLLNYVLLALLLLTIKQIEKNIVNLNY